MLAEGQSRKMGSKKKVKLSTTQVIALGFLGVIFLGSFLLYLPISNQEPIKYIDALFTAVTAVCVTGLITVFPATQFTLFGKIVMLALIQIGGLGIICCAMTVFIIIRKKITMKNRVMIQQTYDLDTLSGMVQFIIRVIKITFLIEGIGAVLYSIKFIPQFGVIRGIWYGVFYSISAFCNAGLDILGESSLISYANSPIINFTTMFLIISGGLGFTVWHDIYINIKETVQKKAPLKRIFRKLSLQSKIVLCMTAGLLLLGTFGFLMLEYNNVETMEGMSFGEKLMASAFQSVTTRTAGFASVPQSGLTTASKILGCILMFIGGSSGGTAGGIKTTTMAILVLTCISVVRGQRKTECFGRRLVGTNVRSGIAIALLSFAIWLIGVMGVTILEPSVPLEDILYEVTSAIGTVGLSADRTASLCTGSHVILMILMYIGRIGPITMAFVFAGKEDLSEKFRDLPEKRIMLG